MSNLDRLLFDVHKVSVEAATYIQNKAKNLRSFEDTPYLDTAFSWVETPQGLEYWDDIHEQIIKKYIRRAW